MRINYLFDVIFVLLLSCALADWQILPSEGDIPLNRGGGELAEINGELILFGGYNECFYSSECEHEFFNEVYHYNINLHLWYKPTIIPDPLYGVPGPRAYSGSCIDERQDALIIYGGGYFPVQFHNFSDWSSRSQDYAELWYYFPDSVTQSGRWEKIDMFGCCVPEARSGSEILMFEHNLYLVGGINSVTFQSFEDLWTFNLISKQWIQRGSIFSNNLPRNEYDYELGRYIFPLVKKGTKMYVFSGNVIPRPPLLGVQHQDLWEYSTLTGEWQEILPFNTTRDGYSNGFSGRVHGGMAVVGNKLVTFFGDNNDNANECKIDSVSEGQSPVDETWVFDLHPRWKSEWKKIDVVGDAPKLKRIYYTNSRRYGKIFVYGGFNADCPDSQYNTTFTWNNNVLALSWNDVLSF